MDWIQSIPNINFCHQGLVAFNTDRAPDEQTRKDQHRRRQPHRAYYDLAYNSSPYTWPISTCPWHTTFSCTCRPHCPNRLCHLPRLHRPFVYLKGPHYPPAADSHTPTTTSPPTQSTPGISTSATATPPLSANVLPQALHLYLRSFCELTLICPCAVSVQLGHTIILGCIGRPKVYWRMPSESAQCVLFCQILVPSRLFMVLPKPKTRNKFLSCRIEHDP